MLTTEGISFSAKSANEAGAALLKASGAGKLRQKIIKLKLIIRLYSFINLTF